MHPYAGSITIVLFSTALAAACRSPDRRAEATTTAAQEVSSAERRAEGDLRAVLATRGAVRWTTVARVLGDGTESCIDGRSDRPVLGTPGGDVGEIVVALGALERTVGPPIALDALDDLFDAYEASFGKIYFHSDAQAMDALARALARDPAFASVAEQIATPSGLYRFVLAPPRAYRTRLLEELCKPEHVGCGHLRLALSNAEAYRCSRSSGAHGHRRRFPTRMARPCECRRRRSRWRPPRKCGRRGTRSPGDSCAHAGGDGRAARRRKGRLRSPSRRRRVRAAGERNLLPRARARAHCVAPAGRRRRTDGAIRALVRVSREGPMSAAPVSRRASAMKLAPPGDGCRSVVVGSVIPTNVTRTPERSIVTERANRREPVALSWKLYAVTLHATRAIRSRKRSAP